MKIYRNLVNAVALTLKDILLNHIYADKAIERLFKQNPQWGSRDRRFVAEAIYDIVRNYRLYTELSETKNNFWFITAVWMVIKQIQIPDWAEFKHVNPQRILILKEELKNNKAIYESYPDWLWKLGEQELGNTLWEKEASAMNETAHVFLRVNPLKTNSKSLIENLAKEKINAEEVEGSANAIKLLKRENVFKTQLFKEGHFEVQDLGSQMISEFLDAKPGDTVVDACAGAGGKSLHLAALMQNKGKIISMDVEERKLEELKKRARRAGAFNIEARIIDENKLKSLENKADKLLLDVPCSGLGVLKRNPDTKWKLSEEAIEKAKTTQLKLLHLYSKMVKPGGALVYSTCSILPGENRKQIDKFLSENKEFNFLQEKSILPSQGADGFYMAFLKKN